MTEATNAAQVIYWNDAAGPTWADLQTPLDRQLEPLGRRVMAELDLDGRRVLDVGCGAGATSLALAEAVGPQGAVVGADISRPLLDVARRRAEGHPNLRFEEADAQTAAFDPGAFDVVFSRFGVMFFSDPEAAFANLRRALTPGGQLGFVCWRPPVENPVFVLPMQSVQHFVQPPPPAEPGAPGPFAFADPERVRAILAAAGFADIQIAPHDEKIGSGDLDTALGLALRVGPLGTVLRENPDQRDAVIATVREALAKHVGPDGLKLDSATWIVTARNPA
jgi:ubiquinone/menaquinone biosynthesis C-methylase UbiE